jgi:MFS family permease
MNELESPDDLAPSAKIAGEHPYAIFRNRDFTLFLVGRLIWTFGQQMLSVAVDWEIYKRTNSALALGIVGLSQMVAMVLCTLPAGHIADNFNRKRIILIMTLLTGFVSLSLTFISALNAPVICIYVCLIVLGATRTFLWPANASFLPNLVPRHQFPRAVTFNSATYQLSSALGLAAGGGVIALTHRAWTVYALTTLAALIYFIMVMLIRREHKVGARQPFSFTNLGAGIQFVFENKIILGVITLDLFAVLLGGATSLFPIYARDILKSGPSGLGILSAAMPIGAVTCAFMLTHRPPLRKAGRAMLLSVAVFGAATIAFGFSQWFWFSFAMMVVCGGVDNISVIVRHSLVQLLTPDEKRGRVSAVNSLFIGTSNEFGGFESGVVAYLFGTAMGHSNSTGAIISVVSGGIGTILVVLAVAWIWPQIRRYGKLG